ncbi:MAG: TIR domain-containing protein [Steroidobacteraceae bacterium]
MSEDSPNQTGRSVFVSYASQDAAIANTVVEHLEQHGIRCWIAPRDVKPGAQYADAIVRAINEAKTLVLVLSQSAVGSSHVGREIERAASKHKQIIALKVDAATLTPGLEYFLSESQWIDVAALGMPAALGRLAEAMGQGAAEESVEPDSAPKTADGMPARRSLGVSRRVAIVAGVAIGAMGVAVALHFWPATRGDAEAPTVAVAAVSDKSIAVLPFADMSQKKDQEYFGDGMAEEILDLLAKIPGLTVIGRTSSFQFKGKNEDLRTIGAKLNAAYVLEGSVRNSGDQVRVTAQLINTRTGAHEWSETYDRPIGDVLKLQDAIAAAVVRELQLTVDPGYLPSRSTLKSADTYDLILRGRHAADRWDKEGLDEAVTLFQQALDRDPSSADAAAELAFAYYKLGADSFLAPAAAFEPARREATIALQLDPTNVLAHVVLCRISMVYDWDWTAAEHELREVTRLAPGSADGLNLGAHLSVIMGRWDDALRLNQAALAQDPMYANSIQYLALIQARRGRLSEAETAIRRALDIRSTYAYGHYYLGLFLLERGNREASLLEMEQETTDDGKQAGLAIVYYALGRKEESDVALSRLVKERADVDAFMVAAVFAQRGQSDEAMHWLERAYVQKDAGLFSVKFDFPLKKLESDPRYKAFLKKMNLPE